MTQNTPRTTSAPLRSFGRIHGRKLRPRQEQLVHELLPSLILPSALPSDLGTLFPGTTKEYELEIGFGGGEHLAHRAKLHPTHGFIGAEPFMNGVAQLLQRIDSESLHNIRIWPHDIRVMLSTIPAHSLSRVHILFPDPWPKAKHQRRRLIQPSLLDELARILIPQGTLHIATDDVAYLCEILYHLEHHTAFTWNASRAQDWKIPHTEWISTRYEMKAMRAARASTYLLWRNGANQ